MSNYMLERVFTMMIRQDDGSYKILYPKTAAEQVMATDITLKEHCTDFLSHIYSTERRLINNVNRPNGYVLLEEGNFLGTDRIKKELLAINKEYDTIADLLLESKAQPGKLVMVLDGQFIVVRKINISKILLKDGKKFPNKNPLKLICIGET